MTGRRRLARDGRAEGERRCLPVGAAAGRCAGAAREVLSGRGLGCDAVVAGGAAATLGGAEGATVTEDGGANDGGWPRRCCFGRGFGLFALEDGLEGVAGLETLERSNFGLVSAGCLDAVLLLPPFLKYSRTLSAWSASMELEWVFPVTPIASERVQNWPALYFQFPCQIVDSNFAHPSLSFLLPCALSCSYQPHGGLNLYCKCCP